MTVKKVSNIFNVSEETVRRWIRKGELNAMMVSRKKGYSIGMFDLKEFVEKRPKYEKYYQEYRKHFIDKLKQAMRAAAEILPTLITQQQMMLQLKQGRET